MPPDEPIAEAGLWLEYAQSDFQAALACADRPQVHGWTIAFHCHQAVEKAYKGALIVHGCATLPRTHNLIVLSDMLLDLKLIGPLQAPDLEVLGPFAVRDKYPSLIIQPIPRADAIALIAHAQVALDWLGGMLVAESAG